MTKIFTYMYVLYFSDIHVVVFFINHAKIRGMKYSLACFVKSSLSSLVLNIWITVSFLHQILDYTEMSFPVVQKSMLLLHACIMQFYSISIIQMLGMVVPKIKDYKPEW